MPYSVASFFAGIGGFDLAFEAAGFDIILQVEINEFCQRILTKHWPNVPKIKDIRSANATNVPYADVFCGGFPCQPHSLSGNRLGAEDERNLWPDFERLIRIVRPRALLLENVPGILTTMGTGIIADLAQMGYVGRAGVISAFDAGAPHIRERWWVMAHTNRHRYRKPCTISQTAPIQKRHMEPFRQNRETIGDAPLPSSPVSRGFRDAYVAGLGRDSNGFPYRLDRPRWPAPPGPQHDWEPPRVTERTEYRADRLKALGNAVVPQVVYPLAVMIREWLERQDQT